MLSLKLYWFLLNFYPATFRENYAGPLERAFLDEYGEAPTRWAVAGLWLNTLGDFVKSAPLMLAREFSEDTRHALRMWRRRPLPMLMAILALAIGIGANIGVFSVVDALLLRSLPFREPENLVAFKGFIPVKLNSPAPFHEWRRQSQYLQNADVYMSGEANLTGGGNPTRVQLTEATADFFDLMGTVPRVGRGFSAGEDTPGRNGVAVIGYGLWQQMFDGESRALGSKIYVNGTALDVIGVAPPGFDFPSKSAIWTPTVFEFDKIPKTTVNFWQIIGRLKSGLSFAQARQAFDAEVDRVQPGKTSPGAHFDPPKLEPLRDELVGSLKQPSLILSAAVGLLLLIACANVANLLLSRTADRVNELSIRSALGASRARLIQQLLTESLVLAAVGGAASVVLANWVVKTATAFQPAGLSSLTYTLSNWRVITFAAGLALATALIFGTAPALFAGSSMIRGNSAKASASRLRSLLVAVQIGLAVVLVAGGATLGWAFSNMMASSTGYLTENVVSLRVSLAGGRYEEESAKAKIDYSHEALRRIRNLPGVSSASASTFLPLGTNAYMGGHFLVDGSGPDFMAANIPVAPGFFQTMGATFLAGRDLMESASSEAEAVVSESFALQFSADPRLVVGRELSTGKKWTRRIVGVVRDMTFNGPAYNGPQKQIFPINSGATLFVIRVEGGDPHARMSAIQYAVKSVDAQIPVYNAMTMSERLAEATARPRFYTLATAMFGTCALLLSIVGLYGMISYSVTQRTREMGIRMALGTTPAGLRLMMLRQGLLLVALGAVPGVITTIFAAQWLEQLVRGANNVASIACAASLGAIAAIAAFSVWTATSRIAKLDPSAALRVE